MPFQNFRIRTFVSELPFQNIRFTTAPINTATATPQYTTRRTHEHTTHTRTPTHTHTPVVNAFRPSRGRSARLQVVGGGGEIRVRTEYSGGRSPPSCLSLTWESGRLPGITFYTSFHFHDHASTRLPRAIATPATQRQVPVSAGAATSSPKEPHPNWPPRLTPSAYWPYTGDDIAVYDCRGNWSEGL